MPVVSSACASRPAATRLACLLATCLLPACADRAPADSATSATTTPTPSTLSCMPGALVSLQLPLREGFALAHDDPGTGVAVGRCVLSLFGTRTLKSPAAFDRGYGRVFAYHEEDGTLDLRALSPTQLQLFRVGSTTAADVWLLRTDIGTILEPAHRDVLFTTGRVDGALVDHLLVGSMGILYRRDYDIETADAFAIIEDTGRGAEIGPGYRASYRIGDDGRYSLVSGEVIPVPGTTEPASPP
ncbi:hypothetical protein ACW5EG_05605 [Luteimonas sp. A611]